MTRTKVLADLRKARLNKYMYFAGGLGLIVLSILLVVLYAVGKRDWGALILAPIGIIFSVIMFYQSRQMGFAIVQFEAALDEGDFEDEEADEGEDVDGEESSGTAEPFVPGPTAARSSDRDDDTDTDSAIHQGDDPGEP